MGNLLKHIADIENYIEQAQDQPQQQKQQPVAKAPVKGITPAGARPTVKNNTTQSVSKIGQPMGQQTVDKTPGYSNQ